MFGWLKRNKPASVPKKHSHRLPKRELAPVEEIVEQQLSVADVAVRMTVKNEIIMSAMGKHDDYDESHVRKLVKNTAIELAVERENDAEQIDVILQGIRRHGTHKYSESSYIGSDSKTLLHRQEVYIRVAEELRTLAEDDEYLHKNAKRARDLAWRDISDSLARKANHPYYSNDHAVGYESGKDERIQTLISEDLVQLQKDMAKKKGNESVVDADSVPVSFLD